MKTTRTVFYWLSFAGSGLGFDKFTFFVCCSILTPTTTTRIFASILMVLSIFNCFTKDEILFLNVACCFTENKTKVLSVDIHSKLQKVQLFI